VDGILNLMLKGNIAGQYCIGHTERQTTDSVKSTPLLFVVVGISYYLSYCLLSYYEAMCIFRRTTENFTTDMSEQIWLKLSQIVKNIISK